MRSLLILLMMLGACTETSPDGPVGTSRTAVMEIPLPGSNDTDILLVVDDSPAMATHHDQVRASAAALISVLSTVQGGLPNIHIGVISTDVGTIGGTAGEVPGPAIGTLGQGGCSGSGKNGNLVTNGASVTGTYVSDLRQGDGSRIKNYTGDLTATLEKMVDLGAGGCAYVRPLEAAKRALANNPANAGFLRENAYLAVIVISADDDCSFGASSFLSGASTTDTSRCQSTALPGIDGFAAALKGHKTDPSKVMVMGALGASVPRLQSFFAAFPNRSSQNPLDGTDPALAFELLANLQKSVLGIACWSAPLADLDPVAPGLQAECTGELRTAKDAFPMQRCAPGLTTPCFTIAEDAQECIENPYFTKLDHIDDYRGLATARIECLVDDAP